MTNTKTVHSNLFKCLKTISRLSTVVSKGDVTKTIILLYISNHT